MIELTLTTAENGLAVTLPPELLAAMKLAAGDKLYLAEMLDGSYRLAAHDERALEQIELIDGSMHEEDA